MNFFIPAATMPAGYHPIINGEYGTVDVMFLTPFVIAGVTVLGLEWISRYLDRRGDE